MGLDMYLKAKRYVYKSAYDNEPTYPKQKLDAFDKAIYDTELPKEFDTFGSRSFNCTAMYWRKANQIHHWFVQNVQGGEDECKPHYVDKGALESLLKDVRAVLADTTRAHELLPVASGCFFGSQNYDEFYFQDLEYTEKRLAKILAMEDLDKWSFEYQSSW